jgi:hypothetical protein
LIDPNKRPLTRIPDAACNVFERSMPVDAGLADAAEHHLHLCGPAGMNEAFGIRRIARQLASQILDFP